MQMMLSFLGLAWLACVTLFARRSTAADKKNASRLIAGTGASFGVRWLDTALGFLDFGSPKLHRPQNPKAVSSHRTPKLPPCQCPSDATCFSYCASVIRASRFWPGSILILIIQPLP